MKHIYISPHADDVALSCGGQIIANSARHSDTIVLTVFKSQMQGVDQVSRQARKTFSGAINSSRHQEDASAWHSLGVSADYLDLPEALVRRRFPFAIIASGKDDQIIDQLCAAIHAAITAYPDATFYFPAGFGNHVDHLACRNAAFRLLDERVLDKITLYEDIPYCWLGFIRNPYYKVLLQRVNVAEQSEAFRPDGLTLPAYLKQKRVPFPRGRKLFVAVYLSLFFGRLRHIMSRKTPLYTGKINRMGLSKESMAQKKELLFLYKSQIPQLFGAHPNRLLNRFSRSFATEVLIEISRPSLDADAFTQ